MNKVIIVINIIALALLPGAGAAQETAGKPAKDEKSFHFKFRVYDAMTIRKNPTTQIAIAVQEWPGNTFLLWLPESVAPLLWNQWIPEVAHQDFSDNGKGGLRWSYTKKDVAHMTAELQPQDRSLACIVQVTNLSDTVLDDVSAQNCFHLSLAPDFACDDFSRIFIRTGGHWKSLKELQPDCALPMYYRPGFLKSGKTDSWGGIFREYNQSPRADHPLMMCLDTDGKRTVATASADYQCVFHNQGSEYLRCIHSQQSPVAALAPGETATFRQWIFFVEGGIQECLRQFNQSEATKYCKQDEAAYGRGTCLKHPSNYARSK